MARVVVGDPFANQIPTTAPTANVVDIYQRGVVKRSPFEALAETLTAIERKAVPALAREEERRAKQEIAQGQRLYEENRIAIGDAVRKGIIEEGASPYLRKGYRISQMSTLSTRYASELENALEVQKLYHSGDPAKIEGFVKKFQSDFVQANGLSEFSPSEVSEYFGATASKADEAFRASWTSKHIAWQKEQNYVAFEQNVATQVAALIKPDMTDAEEAMAYAKAKMWIEKQAQERAIDGQDNKRVADAIVNGILFAAEANADPELLDLLLDTKVGTDVIGKSVSRMKQVFDTKVTIARLNEAAATKANAQAAQEIEDLRGEVSANVFENVYSAEYDPTYVNAQIAKLSATGNEDAVNEAISLRNLENSVNSMLNDKLMTPELMAGADALMAGSATLTDARNNALVYVQSNNLGAQDLKNMLSNWQSNFSPKGDQYGLKFNVGTSPEGALMGRLKATILGSEFSDDYANEEKADAFRRARMVAQRDIRKFVKDYQAANNGSEVPEDEIETFIYGIEAKILTTISSNGTTTTQALLDMTASEDAAVLQFGN